MSLIIDSVSKRFGEVLALDDVSLSIEPGQIFGLLGANGAGKTTAMRVVLDILRPDSGTITWNGTPNTSLPRETWGYLPEERGLYAKMKVLHQLVFFAKLHGIGDERSIAEFQHGVCYACSRADFSMFAHFRAKCTEEGRDIHGCINRMQNNQR